MLLIAILVNPDAFWTQLDIQQDGQEPHFMAVRLRRKKRMFDERLGDKCIVDLQQSYKVEAYFTTLY